ncbi:MAG: TRAP transporter large permease subunit [Pseudomonadota bacterium]
MTVAVFLVALMGAMALGMPIAFALLVCAFALQAAQGNLEITIVAQKLIEGADNYPLLAIPFFILAGEIMNASGMARRIVQFAMACVGHIRGGLGLVVIFAGILLAAISGSAAADAAILAAMVMPVMRSAGHDPARSAGLISCSAIIAPVLPPSVAIIVFCVISNVSIGKMFMAGIVPGIMLGVALVIAWMWVVRKEQVKPLPRQSGAQVLRSFREAFLGLLMPIGIVGGMKTGLFTPTEAAVVACAYALVVGLVIHREMKPSALYGLFVNAVKTTAVVVFTIAAALASAWFITVSEVPAQVEAILRPFSGDPKLLMLAIMILVLVVGTALDFAPTLMILTPVLMPVVAKAGIDPVYFGILFIIANAIGLVTPPVGIVLNVVSGVGKVTMTEVTRGIWPFLLAQTAVLMLLVAFPALVLVPMRWLLG